MAQRTRTYFQDKFVPGYKLTAEDMDDLLDSIYTKQDEAGLDSAGSSNQVIESVKKATAGSLAIGNVVRIAGYSSGVTVELADASASSTMPFLGIMAAAAADETVAANCVTYGQATGLNTDGMTVGASVFVSETAGGFTTTAPTGSAVVQKIGTVVVADASAGIIFIDPGEAGTQAGIDDLDDVDTSTVAPTDGQVLTYDSSASKWEPADAAGGGASVLADLTDVAAGSPSGSKQPLVRNSANNGWEPGTISESYISNYTSATTNESSGTVLNLKKAAGTHYGVNGTPLSDTSFTLSNITTGGKAVVYINTTSEPTITGSTKLTSSAAWQTGTDMFMKVWCFSDNNSSVYHEFIEI